MKNFKFLFQLFAYSLLLLMLPTLASAQFRGNRDYDDDRYRNNGRYNNFNDRELQNAINRVERNSDRFTREVDRALDNSRLDGSRREDRINDIAREFENSADRLKNSYNDGRNFNRSANDAQQLIQIGFRIDRFINNRGFSSSNRNNRAVAEWSVIRRDLAYINNAYNNRNNRGYNNGGYDNDRYDNGRNNRRGNGRGNNRRVYDDDDRR
ncbi:MAG: hypothetical protein H7Z37_01455 [Pyrinomonadaceae bacterium]|nr:hypothetical protein [Pyrinomonadaceae bacterium]